MSTTYRHILCPACDREIDVAPDGLVPDHVRSSTGVPAHACPAAGFKALPEAPPFFPGVPARINAGGVCTGAHAFPAGNILYCSRTGPHAVHDEGRAAWLDGMDGSGSSEPAVEA